MPHLFLAILEAAAGTLGLVSAWICAIIGWRKYGAEKTVLAVVAFLAAGIILWIMALYRAARAAGQPALSPVLYGGLVGLSIPLVGCLIAIIVLFAKEKGKGSID